MPVRQETILLEAAQRVRRYTGISERAKHSRPLIVVVTKYDSWASLLGGRQLLNPWVASAKSGLCAMQLEAIDDLSHEVHSVLWKLSPEIVSAAESFAEQVIYLPVSAGPRSGGRSDDGTFGFRPRNINPIWAETPLLYVMSRWLEGLVPQCRPKMPATIPLSGTAAPAACAECIAARRGTGEVVK